jgi:glycosyltransferase involved in cell wall biosynthesis
MGRLLNARDSVEEQQRRAAPNAMAQPGAAVRDAEPTPSREPAQADTDVAPEREGRPERGRTLRVLYFGTYERGYPRNAQVISALRGAGVAVSERHVAVWDGREHKWEAGIGAVPRLVLAQARLLRRREAAFDVIIVGYPGHLDLPAARRAARGRPLVFNPLVSLHDTLVEDRRRFGPGSPPARLLALIDRRALRSADVVVADTQADADFLATFADLPTERVRVCFVGAEERLFAPGWAPREPFTALFVGKLIPLHGVETVLAAARAAPELGFKVVGSGQLEPLLRERPPNVEWTPWVDYERLPAELHRAGCALGIFGTSAKASRVIPNKVFQALACGTPVVTADTPAARELLADGESALLVPPGDPDSLADALRLLAADAGLARRIGGGGHVVYEARASEHVLGRRWRGLLEELVA